MTFADQRDLRKQMRDAYRARRAGQTGDNRDALAEVAQLRAEAAAAGLCEPRGVRARNAHG
jgi:Zn-dependent oligopeptidase